MPLSKSWRDKLKKNVPIVLLCAVIVAGSYAALFHHNRTFSFADNDVVYKIESKLLDLRFRARGPRPGHKKIGILAIDERSVREAGYPVDRSYYETAFRHLKALGVKWIGFDIIFSEPQNAALRDVMPELKPLLNGVGKDRAKQLAHLENLLKVSPQDAALARGIQDFGNVVEGYFYFVSEREAKANIGSGPRFPQMDVMESSQLAYDVPQGRKLEDYEIPRVAGINANFPLITAASPHYGFFSNDGDDDAVNRWVTQMALIDGRLMPSLSLKTAAEYLNRDIFVFFDNIGVSSISLVNRDDPSDTIEIPSDPRGSGRVLINQVGPSRSYHHYSLADAYHNKFTEEEKKNLRNSVLLLGGTATGTNDLRPNAFDSVVDGVENHAAVIESIVTKRFMKRPLDIHATELMIVLGVGLLFSPLMIWGRAVFSGLAVVLFLAAYYYVDKKLWFDRGIWAYMGVPALEIISLFLVTTIYKYMTEEKEKRKVKGAFRYYLSPDVIDQVLDDPDSLQLGGVKKELTVFFSDVRGFTTISESLSPEKLCELMNDYFTPVTSLILRTGGVLDKYIGDAVMAFWGAPIAMADSPDRAAMASIQMLYVMDKLRVDFPKKGFPIIDIGIGLNTGMMAVGNMGSGERFCYTVMGDAVNLGSRLESLTKEYGIKIMISEFTHARLTKGKFLTRDLDDIRVKGKNEPVRVYELMRPDFMRQQSHIPEFIQSFEAGRRAYGACQWQEAKTCFQACLMMHPEDKASAVYLDRISYFETEAPPPEKWDGVYTFKHK